MARQRFELKIEELVDIQRPRLVLLIEREVFRLEQLAVGKPDLLVKCPLADRNSVRA